MCARYGRGDRNLFVRKGRASQKKIGKHCIISMFLTSFNVCFVFGCVYAVKLLSGIFWGAVWLFLVKTGWQPCFRLQ